jgi:hypothetical protein
VMKFVEFYHWGTDGAAEKIGIIRLVNGVVIFEDLPPKLQEDLLDGVNIKGRSLYPSDGAEFLDAVVSAYSRGSYVWTSKVQEKG